MKNYQRRLLENLGILAVLAGCSAEPKKLLEIYDIASAETATIRHPEIEVGDKITRLSYTKDSITATYFNCNFDGLPYISRHPFSLENMKKDILYFDPNFDGIVDTTYTISKKQELLLSMPCHRGMGFSRPDWFVREIKKGKSVIV